MTIGGRSRSVGIPRRQGVAGVMGTWGVTMYLFTRSITLTGSPGRTIDYALKTAEIVNDTIDLDVALWSNVFGQPAGTFSFNTMVDGRAALGPATTALMGNSAYLEQLERGQEFAGAALPEDILRQLVHPTELAGDGAPVGSFAEAITVVPAAGQIGAAMGWAVEIANLATSVTGIPVSFWLDAYGTFGQMTWLIVYPDAAAVDAAADKLNASAEYIASLDSNGALFVPGSGERALYARIA